MRRFNKKILSLVLAIALMSSLIVGISWATGSVPSYSDVPESYWGNEAITKWSSKEYGILQGDGNGNFYPEDAITAEQLAWINGRICGIADADAKYTGNGHRELTRAEAVAIIAQAFCIEPLDNAGNTFADNADIPAAYRGYVNAMKAAGYIKGVENNCFAPNDTYTRAQALQVIYNMISDITDKNVSNVAAPENYIIRKAGVQLKDSTIDGNLIIGHGVGNGEVMLENVTVNGQLIVFGGGSNSIIVRGKSNIADVNIYKTTGQPVRVKVEGEAVVKTVAVAENSKAIVNGTVTALIANGNTSVEFQNASVVTVTIDGSDVTVNVDGRSTVQTVTIDAPGARIAGSGKVINVVVTANAKSDIVIDTKGTKVDVAKDACNVTDSGGKVIAQSGQSATTAGSSNTQFFGGGGGYTPPGGNGSGIRS